MKRLTSQELARQDYVDNTIHEMLSRLCGFELAHDRALIGEVRDEAQAVICGQLGLMTEQEFYPYLEED